MVQLQPTSSNQQKPAATSGNQPRPPEPDCDFFWSTLTRYVSDASPLLPSRFKAVRSTIASWRHHGSLGGFRTLSFPPTLLQTGLGGEGVPAPTARPSSPQSTRP
jgi:hypothetical protein